MSFQINVSGHGADPDDLREAFGNLIRALRTISDPVGMYGTCAGTENQTPFTIRDHDIEDLAPADVSDDLDAISEQIDNSATPTAATNG